ncbi:hypothetical protein NJ76_24305 [Rhodococcus sp. IITR03]|nr:hypothetical protein NJ76_24305 [Rhodococcus sp. IITR03]
MIAGDRDNGALRQGLEAFERRVERFEYVQLGAWLFGVPGLVGGLVWMWTKRAPSSIKCSAASIRVVISTP